ncbi:hypothetical protein ACHQM5_015973 [Ranunculus cassubicifolius]
MGELEEKKPMREEEEDEDVEEAEIRIWKYVFGFVEMAVVKCAIELGIADAIDAHGLPMTLSELSEALGCSSLFLHRIMRFLVHQNIFKERCTSNGTKCYALTLLSRFLIKREERNMVAFMLLESSTAMLAPWQYLSGRVRENGPPPYGAAHGDDVWAYAEAHPEHSKLIEDAMACDAKVAVSAVIDSCAELFKRVDSVVDVGGGDGTALRLLVKAFPWIKGINFDLPHVVSVALESKGVEHVGGDMFQSVPKANAAFLMWVLHDWGDDECVTILKNCREAIIGKEKGKVIIVEAVINEDENHKFKHVGLMLDMVMMAHTINGKERTEDEWGYIIRKAGFARFTVDKIHAVKSVITAYP